MRKPESSPGAAITDGKLATIGQRVRRQGFQFLVRGQDA
jgi:hypothetical protein